MEKKVYASDTSELAFDDKNFNRHTKRGMEMLKQSVERNGFGRSVLVDKNGRLIGGNGMVETANALGKKAIKVVETTGDELVVVKRIDVDLDSKQGREMALADNVTGAVDLEFDETVMRELMSDMPELSFGDWGIDLFKEDTEVQEEEHFVPKPFREEEEEEDAPGFIPEDDDEEDVDALSFETPEDSEDVPGNDVPRETPKEKSYEYDVRSGDVWRVGGISMRVDHNLDGGAMIVNAQCLKGLIEILTGRDCLSPSARLERASRIERGIRVERDGTELSIDAVRKEVE